MERILQSCVRCPSAKGCAGSNLHPILKQVYYLYTGGVTNKYEILDALDDASEDLLLRFNDQVSSVCWTKAAILTIAEIIQELFEQDDCGAENLENNIRICISRASNAFEQFPWQFSNLVEQAPDLYEAALETCSEFDLAKKISKRQLVKICKDIAYS